MKVTLPTERIENGKNFSKDKETHAIMHVIALTKKGPVQCITTRFYSGRSRNASVHYCSIWYYGNKQWGAGHGQAGGWGYHKDSAALDSAIRSAGIKLDKDISGVGNSAMREALTAIANKLGYRKIFIVEQ